jgi:hypothetical protein
MIYLQGWIQAIELILVVWFIAWASTSALDFYRAGMERVLRLNEREGNK